MIRMLPALAVIATATLFGASTVEARLLDPSSPLPNDRVAEAVHLPTGCIARIVFSGSNLVEATITDTSCLPAGVRARAIPASTTDFRLIDGR